MPAAHLNTQRSIDDRSLRRASVEDEAQGRVKRRRRETRPSDLSTAHDLRNLICCKWLALRITQDRRHDLAGVRFSAGIILVALLAFAFIVIAIRSARPSTATVVDEVVDLGGGVSIEMSAVPAGSFMMGSGNGLADEKARLELDRIHRP